MALPYILTLVSLDVAGRVAKTVLLVAATIVDPSGAAIDALRTALAAVSDAKTTKASLAVAKPIAGTPASTPYSTQEDYVEMRFLDDNGKTTVFKVPAPLASCFYSGANNLEVDPTAGGVPAYISAVLGNCVSASGVAFASFAGGTRKRKRTGKTQGISGS